jgi:hypothetical protein
MEALIQALKTLPVSAVVLDASGTIIAVNRAWKEFGRRNGLRIPNWGVGASYLKYSGGKGRRSERFVRDLKDLLAGRLDLLTTVYPCHSPNQKRWFLLVGLPFPLDKPTGAALLHVNLTTMLKLPAAERRQNGAVPHVQRDVSARMHHSRAQLEVFSDVIERSVFRNALGPNHGYVSGGHFRSPTISTRRFRTKLGTERCAADVESK